ncbi:Neurocan core protein, partial [Orchesella cincta]
RIHSSFTDSRGVNHNYFFSWLDSRTQAGFTWSDARGICRRHCMDLVSPETPWENSWLKQQGIPGQGIWTSGTKQGSLVNGWFGERLKPQTTALNGDWSSGQPDNNDGTGEQNWARSENDGFYYEKGRDEGCLAVMNNFDGIKWNDQACNLRKAFVCEDSDSLLSFVGLRNSGGGNFGNSNNNRDFRPVGNSNNNGDFRPVGNNNNWNSRPNGNNNNN